MTDIYLHFLFAHYGLYGNAPVPQVEAAMPASVFAPTTSLFLSLFEGLPGDTAVGTGAAAGSGVGRSGASFDTVAGPGPVSPGQSLALAAGGPAPRTGLLPVCSSASVSENSSDSSAKNSSDSELAFSLRGESCVRSISPTGLAACRSGGEGCGGGGWSAGRSDSTCPSE